MNTKWSISRVSGCVCKCSYLIEWSEVWQANIAGKCGKQSVAGKKASHTEALPRAEMLSLARIVVLKDLLEVF